MTAPFHLRRGEHINYKRGHRVSAPFASHQLVSARFLNRNTTGVNKYGSVACFSFSCPFLLLLFFLFFCFFVIVPFNANTKGINKYESRKLVFFYDQSIMRVISG